MADVKFKALIDHPEKREIISRLVTGENPKQISAYLRNKYKKDDEKHLKLSSNLLKDFIDTYGAHYNFANHIVKKSNDSQLDKQIAESLLDNREWKERVAEITDEEIDFKKKLKQVLLMVETRTEQLFDLIQARPENTKNDYILNKNMELLSSIIEKADKLFNDKPDLKIEHTYTLQMVEQHSTIIQEAIRRVLARMSPEDASFFMTALQEEFDNVKPSFETTNPDKIFSKNVKTVDKFLEAGEKLGQLIDGEMEDENV